MADPTILAARYRLDRLVAEGGMASVWQAHDAVLARTVAVKLLHPHLAADADFRERFRREAVSAAKLTHPNIVSLYDTGSDGDAVYLVMEYIDGLTLSAVIADLGRLDIATAASIAAQVATALDYAHIHGIIHRDVKPGNILLTSENVVKIADFGIAKAEETDDLTATGTVLGTAAYLAPEQIEAKDIDGRADQYALGCVLYEALTGRPPFTGASPMETAAARLRHDPLPVRSLRPDVPKPLAAVVMRMLRREPNERYPSAAAAAEALTPMADGRRPATRVSPPPAAHERARREESFLRSEGRWLVPVVSLLVFAGVVLAGGLTGVLPRPDEVLGGGADNEVDVQTVAAVAAEVFDPFGSGGEGDRRLPNLLDDDDSTFWRTQLYANPSFGNLKEGVGVWLDLGAVYELRQVAVRTTTPGISYELRVAMAPQSQLEGWTPAGAVPQAEGLDVTVFPDPVTAQYLLIWITGNLQPHEGRYAATFAAVVIDGIPA